MILILPSQATVLNAYAVLVGMTPGYAAFKDHQAYIAATSTAGYKSALEGLFAATSTASLATTMLTNLGLSTAFTQAQAEAFLAANTGNRVGAMIDLASALYVYAGADAGLLAAKAAYVNAIDTSYAYSNNSANVNGAAWIGTGGQTVSLTTGFDNLMGSALADVFLARTVGNSNTLNDRDMVDGGAGNDTLFVDFTALGTSITPVLKNIETVVIRAQSQTTDTNGGATGNDGNNMVNNEVQIDAQRSLAVDNYDHVTAAAGVTRWESNNSRSDVIIEDVRIGNSQKTKDITIAMVETDPGNVDFGVYFDQLSLRNAATSNSTITIQLMDTGAAAGYQGADTTKPLLNNPYDTFKFLLNGVQVSINLNPAGSTTVASSADTYAQLLAAFQVALTGTGVTASLGADFSLVDPLSTNTVTGKSIVLTGGGATIATNALSGWYNTLQAPVPADANIYNKFTSGASSITELVTSTVVLDDVGRGSTGGDLVIGGLSVGDTSTSRGVERFEITVNDNSKLQTINSTNNALREVTIVNGTTSNVVPDAYTTTVTNSGNLTVNGKVGDDDTLAGVENGSAVGVHDTTYGFTDVRLIDGSAMTGKLAFTAQVTTDSLAKYVNLTDTANSPTADVASTGNVNFNVMGANFAYSGGTNNDTISVLVDSTVAASTTLTGQSDFTLVIDGGAGNDVITTNIGGSETAAWLVDQKRNANITITAGEGDDTVTTTGAGAVIISTAGGSDTVYTDNSGNKATWVVNDVAPALTADLWSAGTGGAGFLFGGKLTVSLSGAAVGGGVTAGVADSAAGTTADHYTNGFEVVVDIPTGTNYVVSQFYINQAIKNAINNNAVLSKLLVAKDGPSNTLTIDSKIDGAFVAGDLKMSITAADLTTATAADQALALAAYKIVAQNSAAVIGTAQTANAATVTLGNSIAGMDTNQVLGATTGSNILLTTAVTVQGVTEAFEVQTIDVSALNIANGATVSFVVDGVTMVYTNGSGGALTGNALEIDIVATGLVPTVANGSTYAVTNPGAGTGDLTFTQSVVGKNIALVTANAGAITGVLTTDGAAAVKEVFTVTVAGTAGAGETIAFAGHQTTAGLLVGDNAATVAAALQVADTAAAGTYDAAVVGNVVTYTANVVGATADITSASFTSSITTVNSTGSQSTAESDNVINLGSGTSDTLVLGTGALSNDVISFTSYELGRKTIVNFTDGAVAAADVLNFTSYLVDKSSASGSTESQVRIATSLNGDTTVEANSVTVISSAIFTATDTFAGLTAAKLLLAINTTGTVAYGGIVDGTLNATNTYIGSGAGTTLVGGIGHAVVMVENNANEGEYAVFELTFNGLATNTTNAFSAATLIGTVDFGNQVNGLVLANLA